MATEKSIDPLRDAAVESLLAEIVNKANLTCEMLRSCSQDDPRGAQHLLRQLEHTVAHLGWAADLALSRMNSVSSLHDGKAECWMLPPVCLRALFAWKNKPAYRSSVVAEATAVA